MSRDRVSSAQKNGRYIYSLASACVVSPVLITITAFWLIVAILPAVLPLNTGATFFNRAYYELLSERLGISIDANDEDLSYVNSIVKAEDDEAFYAALASYCLYRSTNPTASPEGSLQWQARSTLADLMAQSSSYSIPLNTCDQSALMYAATELTSLPYLFWLAPAIASAGACAFLNRRGSLLSQAPISPRQSWLGMTTASALVAALAFVAIMGPGFLLCLARNGLGSLDSPIVYIKDNGVVSSSLEVLLRDGLTLLSLTSLGLCVLGCLLARLSRSVQMPLATIVTIALVPLIVDPEMLGAELQALLPYLPTTYYSLSSVVGSTSYAMVDITNVAGITANFGVKVLGTSIAVVIVAAIALLRKSFDAKRLSGQSPHTATYRPDALEASDLTVGFRKNQILLQASCAIQSGEICGLLAPNGTGKTTFLRLLDADVPRRSRGSISCKGIAINEGLRYRKRVFYAECDANLLYGWLSIECNLSIVCCVWGNDCVSPQEVVELFGMKAFAKQPIAKLSQGQRQIGVLACAYASGCDYALLDEPMNALDALNVQKCAAIFASMCSQGRSILMSSHLLDNIDQLCDRVIFLSEGKFFEPETREGTKHTYESLYGI